MFSPSGNICCFYFSTPKSWRLQTRLSSTSTGGEGSPSAAVLGELKFPLAREDLGHPQSWVSSVKITLGSLLALWEDATSPDLTSISNTVLLYSFKLGKLTSQAGQSGRRESSGKAGAGAAAATVAGDGA